MGEIIRVNFPDVEPENAEFTDYDGPDGELVLLFPRSKSDRLSVGRRIIQSANKSLTSSGTPRGPGGLKSARTSKDKYKVLESKPTDR